MIADAPWILNSYSLWRHPSDVCCEVAEIPETAHFTLIRHATNIQSWNCVNLNDSAGARDFVEFIRTMKSKSRVSTLQQWLVFKSLSKSVYKIAWIQLKLNFRWSIHTEGLQRCCIGLPDHFMNQNICKRGNAVSSNGCRYSL